VLNVQPGPNGRSAGTVSWGGIFNTYCWLDPARRVNPAVRRSPRAEALRAFRERRLRSAEVRV